MDSNNSLNHLAIIMDGNGRWALNQDLPRTAGHAAGEYSLSKTIDRDIKESDGYSFTVVLKPFGSTRNYGKSKVFGPLIN